MREGWKASNSSTRSPTPAQRQARPPGHRGRGERGPAAGVAVELGEHDPGHADAAVELLRAADGVLPGHGVGDIQDLAGLRVRLQLLKPRP